MMTEVLELAPVLFREPSPYSYLLNANLSDKRPYVG